MLLLWMAGVAYAPPPNGVPGPAPQTLKPIRPAGPNEGLAKVVEGNVTVLYPEGWKDAADKVAAKVSGILNDTLKKVGMEYTGRCEITLRPVALDGPVAAMPKFGANEVRFPLAVPKEGVEKFNLDIWTIKQTLFSVLHNALNLQLLALQPGTEVSSPRWFVHGLGVWLSSEAAKKLVGKNWQRLVNLQFSDKVLEYYRDNLLGWNSKARSKNDGVYAIGSAQIFIEIEKKFGPDAIKKIGEGYAKAEKVDRDSLVKIIDEAIGEDFVEFLKNYESPNKYPMLGIMTDPQFNEGGVKVKDVQADTSASEAGLQADDVIVKAEGKDIKNLAALKAAIDAVGVGGKLRLVVERDGEEVELTAVLKERVFKFPPPPSGSASPGRAPQPQPRPRPAPKPKRGATDEEQMAALKAAGFSEAQIELMFKYFELLPAGEKAELDEETEKRIHAFLEEAGFTPLQISVLLSIFRLDLDAVRALPAAEESSKQPNDEGKSAVDMLVERGHKRKMAEAVVQMLKKRGRTEEEIKEMIRTGKLRLAFP